MRMCKLSNQEFFAETTAHRSVQNVKARNAFSILVLLHAAAPPQIRINKMCDQVDKSML